jgi:hypothetical protein
MDEDNNLPSITPIGDDNDFEPAEPITIEIPEPKKKTKKIVDAETKAWYVKRAKMGADQRLKNAKNQKILMEKMRKELDELKNMENLLDIKLKQYFRVPKEENPIKPQPEPEKPIITHPEQLQSIPEEKLQSIPEEKPRENTFSKSIPILRARSTPKTRLRI